MCNREYYDDPDPIVVSTAAAAGRRISDLGVLYMAQNSQLEAYVTLPCFIAMTCICVCVDLFVGYPYVCVR